MPEPRNQPQAIDAFIARKAEIDAMPEHIQTPSDDQFGTSPDEIDWGDVGTLAHYAEPLKRITDAAFRQGEHAD